MSSRYVKIQVVSNLDPSDTQQEASEPEVELHDDDPKAFEIFLRLVYLGGYDQRVINEHLENETTEEPTMITKLCMPIHISILADKYEVFGLLDPASREFFQQIKIMVNKITVYKNSYMSHYEPKLLLKGIKKALELYYTNHVGEPEPIGKIIAFTCMVNLQFYIKDQIIDIVKKYPSFGADWVAYQWEVGAIPRYSIACQSCVDVSSHTNTSKSSCSSYCINRLEQTLFKEE